MLKKTSVSLLGYATYNPTGNTQILLHVNVTGQSTGPRAGLSEAQRKALGGHTLAQRTAKGARGQGGPSHPEGVQIDGN